MCEILDNEDNLRMNITKAQSLCAALSAATVAEVEEIPTQHLNGLMWAMADFLEDAMRSFKVLEGYRQRAEKNNLSSS